MAVDILYLYDKQENFIGTLSNKNSSMCPFFTDNRYERLDNTASTLEFKTSLKHASGIPSRIENEGFVVFRDRDGKFVQYKIIIAEEDRTSRQLYVLAVGSWIELTKEMVEPFSNADLSAKQHLDYFLRNTRWRAGQVSYNGVKTMSSDKMTTALEATQRLRTTFDLEPRFRIEMGVNGEITGRYCDLLERRGIVHPNRFEIGKDVQLLRRKIDTTELVTALYGYGQQEEGSNVDAPLDFSGVQWSKANGDPVDKPFGQKWVGSDEALAKYGGKDKKHRFGVHESTVQGDANSLLQHTWEVLQRRSVPKVTYEVDLAILGDVGIGDTINIVDQKDEDNELYLEARVLELEGPIAEDKKGKAILGNYRELQKVDITDVLQDQLRKYATKVQLQQEVEALNLAVETAKQAAITEANNQIALSEIEAKAYADGIVTAEEERAILDAQNKLAESKAYSETKKQEAISQANTYTDQQTLVIGEEIDEVESQLNATKMYIDGAFADGLVNEAEAKAIEKYLNSLSVEKADVDAKYTEIYNNTDLTDATIKTDLQTKKTAYNTAHSDLINSINMAISDGQTTVEEKQDVDSKFASYRTALANLTTAFEKALTSISQKQADTAKTTAINTASTDATNKANSALSSANTYTDNKDTALRDGLNTGAVAVNATGIHGMLAAGKLDIDLAIQTGIPDPAGYEYQGVRQQEANLVTVNTNYTIFMYWTFKHSKRYITFRIAGRWAGERNGQDGIGLITGGRCDYAVATRPYTENIIPGSQGSFSNESPLFNGNSYEQARNITVDLGAPTNGLRFIYLMFKGNLNEPANNNFVHAFLRCLYVAQHD